MNTDELLLKLEQMNRASGNLSTRGLNQTMPTTNSDKSGNVKLSVSTGADQIDLNNKADQVLTAIYTVKENFKEWCKANGLKKDMVENVINQNKTDVALVHDLHNVRKHGRLNRKPRSGCTPKLKILGESVPVIEYGTSIEITFSDEGAMSGKVRNPDGTPADVALNARIVDENGNELGNFIDLCDRAIEKWHAAFLAAGVPMT